MAPRPASERFWSRIDQSDPVACWIWPGVRGGSKGQYGYFRPGTRESDPKVPAHRFAYEDRVGPIPPGYEIDHVAERGCTSRLCVNPAHLEAVTPEENQKRKRLSVCARGHDLTDPDNVRWDGRGRRRGCIICHREKALERYYRQKAVT